MVRLKALQRKHIIGQLKKLYVVIETNCISATVRKGVQMAVESNNSNHATAEKRTYSVQEIADILQISKSKAYALCKEAPFKTVKVGKYVRISKPSFDAWLDNNR